MTCIRKKHDWAPSMAGTGRCSRDPNCIADCLQKGNLVLPEAISATRERPFSNSPRKR